MSGLRVYLSVDMEGIAGISHPNPTERGDAGYDRAVELMVGEANAAIEGALAAGAADILVNDSHGFMYNLTPATLHPAARVLQGQKPWSMVAGAGAETWVGTAPGMSSAPGVSGAPGPDPLWDVALFVGYHARAGNPAGTIAHSYTMEQTLTTVNGRPTGEYGLNALVLGGWGVPVGLVTGDDALAREVADALPWAERVVVKTGTGGNSAASIHPTRACELVRVGAERAVRRAAAGELRPFVPEGPLEIGVEFDLPVRADFAAIVPGVERVGDRGVRWTAATASDAFRLYLAVFRLSTLVVK